MPPAGAPPAAPHVLLPGALAELDLLLLAADVGLRDVQLLVLGHQTGLDVGGVEPARTAFAGTWTPSANGTSSTRPVTSLRMTRSSPSTKPV